MYLKLTKSHLRTKAVLLVFLFLAATVNLACLELEADDDHRPNVILIMTDDQGYGDFGFTGNAVIRTPFLDALAEKGARIENLYVNPVCAPTRAALMTGRYPYRTRVVDTYLGRAMMEPKELTVAEILKEAGYATGIFGKWHLGDTFPMRSMDQGFEMSLVHRGGGIGQPADPPGGEGKYTDPILFRNGELEQFEGFCTDIYFDEAMDWITEQSESGKSFFAYLPTNAPHGPFNDVPDDLYEYYAGLEIGNDQFQLDYGYPLPLEAQTGELAPASKVDRRARVYAMIENVDTNVGRLIEKLERLGELKNTLILFMLDNGPNGQRYNVGLRGWKGHVHEGGIKSPLIAHWPDRLGAKINSDVVAANIDIMPTILEVAGESLPDSISIDGSSLLPALQNGSGGFGNRHVVIQSHRGNQPLRYHHFALRTPKWKLVHPSGFGNEHFEGDPKFELYNMIQDPYELVDVASERPSVVDSLVLLYDRWFEDVSTTRPNNYASPRIQIGTAFEASTVLTRQDWRHKKGNAWASNSNGFWLLSNKDAGKFDIEIRYPEVSANTPVEIFLNDTTVVGTLPAGSRDHVIEDVHLRSGNIQLTSLIDLGFDQMGASQIVLTKKVDEEKD